MRSGLGWLVMLAACAAQPVEERSREPTCLPPLPQEVAARALAAMGAAGIQVLIEGARSEAPDIRRLCFNSMALYFGAHPPALAGFWEARLIDHEALGSYQDSVDAAIRVILWGVQHDDPATSAAARGALGSLDVAPSEWPAPDTGDGVKVLTGLLDHELASVRRSAALALGRMGPNAAPAVPSLIGLMNRPKDLGEHDWSQEEAATALGRIGPDAKAAIPTLLEWIQEGADDGVRSGEALVALGAMGVREARVTEALLEVVRRDDYLQGHAAQALVRLRSHLDESVRIVAGVAILPRPIGLIYGRGPFDDIGASETLRACEQAGVLLVRAALDGEEAWGSSSVGRAIRMLPDTRRTQAVELLQAEARRARNAHDEEKILRLAAAAAGVGPRARCVVEELVPHLSVGGDEVRGALAEAVVETKLASPEAVKGLARCLDLGSSKLRLDVLRVLWKLGTEAAGAVRSVRRAAVDHDPRVREQALWTLANMGAVAATAHAEIAAGLMDEHEFVRDMAATAVVSVGSSLLMPQLVEALKDGPIEPWRYFYLAWPEGVVMPEGARAAFAERIRADEVRHPILSAGVYFDRSISMAKDQEAALRVLVRALEDPHYRTEALWSMYDMGVRAAPAASAVAGIVETDPDAPAACVLSRMGPAAKCAVPALARVVKANDEGIWAALDALEALGPDAEQAVPAILEVWVSPEPRYREFSWYRRFVNALMAIEPDGRSLKALIPRLREALLVASK